MLIQTLAGWYRVSRVGRVSRYRPGLAVRLRDYFPRRVNGKEEIRDDVRPSVAESQKPLSIVTKRSYRGYKVGEMAAAFARAEQEKLLVSHPGWGITLRAARIQSQLQQQFSIYVSLGTVCDLLRGDTYPHITAVDWNEEYWRRYGYRAPTD